MRSKEFITELFQSGKNWKWEFRASDEAFASFEVGGIEYLWYATSIKRNPTEWTIAFRTREEGNWDKHFGITGTGNSAEVMSTVVDITRAFLEYYGDRVLEIRFSSAENSRTSLYAKMVKRLLPSWNMHSKKTSGETDFFLTNPRAYEMIGEEIEMVDEAINMTHLDEPMKKAVEDGIKTAIGNLYDVKGGYPKLEDRFDTGEGSSAFLNQMVAILFSDFEKWNVVDIVTKSVVAGLTKELGKDVVKKFKFADTKGYRGNADNDVIEINENFIKLIAKLAIKNIIEATISAYGEGSYTGGFWYMINSIKRGEEEFTHVLFKGCETHIDSISSTIVHEVVHVLQHKRQTDIGRSELELAYNSYLDPRNEFSKLETELDKYLDKKQEIESNREHYSEKFNIPLDDAEFTKKVYNALNKKNPKRAWKDADLERRDKMYYSSPQEIAAYANEVAIKIIKRAKLHTINDFDELEDKAKTIKAHTILNAVKSYLEDKSNFSPENKREYAVFKRYVKLTYAALQSWLTKQRERLKD